MTCPYDGLLEQRLLIAAVIVLIVAVGALLAFLRAEVVRRRTIERELERSRHREALQRNPSAFARLRADLLTYRPNEDD